MKKIFDFFGGEKMGLCIIAILICTALYVLAQVLGWDMSADDWTGFVIWGIGFAVAGKAVGMAVHGFSKNPVGSEHKKKE